MEAAAGPLIRVETIFGQVCQSLRLLKKKKIINLSKLRDNKLELIHALPSEKKFVIKASS